MASPPSLPFQNSSVARVLRTQNLINQEERDTWIQHNNIAIITGTTAYFQTTGVINPSQPTCLCDTCIKVHAAWIVQKCNIHNFEISEITNSGSGATRNKVWS